MESRGSAGFGVRRRWQAAVVAALGLAALTGTAGASHLGNDTQGHTTREFRVLPILPNSEAAGAPYTNLRLVPGESTYVVRDAGPEDDRVPAAQPGRETRRESLAYFSQLTDFQLADEESPARVEFADPAAGSATRPQEGFTAFQMEATVRQINEYADASPVPQGDGTFNAMDFALLTGDQADNQQFNETRWVRDLLEGTTDPIDFNSGFDRPEDYAPDKIPGLGASCGLFFAQEGGSATAAAAEGARYTGVQDYDDYPAGPPVSPLYYDPDEPLGPNYDDWPEYDGLLDRAQQISFAPEGLDVPFYVTNGNHDVLLQGNEDANAAFEDVATGCFKALATTNDPGTPPGADGPNPTSLLSAGNTGMLVPPDPDRRFVSKPQIKEVYGETDEGPGDDDHGFAYVDEEEIEASRDSASYYAWDPEQTPGLRFISIDTNSEGGQTAEGVAAGSSNGNIDDPQFQWLKGELQAAEDRNQLVVIFGHHPVRSMSTEIRDEQAAQCTSPPGPPDEHGHDPNPGCDLDPRLSVDSNGCIHNGTDVQNMSCNDAQHESFFELLDQFPNVLSYVPGHTHEHRLTPFFRTDGTTWWEVNTSAVIDYPNQSRLVEIMDNNDGTLSIFNTVVDHASPATAPADCPDSPTTPNPVGDCAASFTEPELASIGRTLTYNDPDNIFDGDGRGQDRNAELLLEDPRPVADLAIVKTDNPATATAGDALAYTLTVTNNGSAESRETTVTDELPAGVSFSFTQTSQGQCTETSGVVECNLGALAGGASATATIVVVPQAAGELTNTASVRGNVSDRDGSNDSDTETTTVLAAPDGGAPGPAPGPGSGGGGGGGGQGGGGGSGGGETCGGRDATLVADPGGDTVRGTKGRDVIVGGDGGDRILGRGDDDLICAGGGADEIKGKGGKDRMRGEGGDDRMRGGSGNDRVDGEGGSDGLRGGQGFDRCDGGPGADEVPEQDCERTARI